MVLVSDRLFHGFINDVLYNQTVTTVMRGEVTVTANIPICKYFSFSFTFLFFIVVI